MSTTTATTRPTSSSSSPSPSPPPHEGQFFTDSGGASPPLIVGFVSLGAFSIGLVCLCAWRKYTGRQFWYSNGFVPRGYYRSVSLRRRRQEQQRLQRDGSVWECKSEKPVIFDAWIVSRTADVLKWAVVSVPFSATFFTEVVESGRTVKDPTPRRIGDVGVEEDEEEEKGGEEKENEERGAREGVDGRLRVAVLLRMPSPNCAGKVGEESLECPVGGELAIGLMEIPWTREDHHSLKRTSSL